MSAKRTGHSARQAANMALALQPTYTPTARKTSVFMVVRG